jgi:hypothetical protein
VNANHQTTAAAGREAAVQAVILPKMDIDHVKALQDLAEVLSAVLCDVPDRIHKAALRDALQTILDVAIENDHRGSYHLFTQFGAEEEGIPA